MTKTKSRLPRAKIEFSDNGEQPSIDTDRLAVAKEAEAAAEDSRLGYEEHKARYCLARAEYRLLVAKRNRLISVSNKPIDVQDAQRECSNAKNRMLKGKTLATEAKDEWKGWEERLAKALTETLPLFDDALLKNA